MAERKEKVPTSVSLTPELRNAARERARDLGGISFSSYVAMLISQDLKRAASESTKQGTLSV